MEITAEEQQRGQLSPSSLELACQRLAEIGYVIFEQVLPLSFMEEVRKAYEANESLAEGKEQRNHFLHGPFLDPRIIDNPFAWQVIEAALGPKFFGQARVAPRAHDVVLGLVAEADLFVRLLVAAAAARVQVDL
ncbi:hypothetical protein CMK14_19040, partial [Candidatus Poribacteria bacterium]|nr:hypothetical protein [Candidatus Poribacteria bacterium]